MSLNPIVNPQASPCLIHKQNPTVDISPFLKSHLTGSSLPSAGSFSSPSFTGGKSALLSEDFPFQPLLPHPFILHRCYPNKSLGSLIVLAPASHRIRTHRTTIILIQTTSSCFDNNERKLPTGLLASSLAFPFPHQSILHLKQVSLWQSAAQNLLVTFHHT